eukprot:CAMPEP_0204511612 /NCGR_PEP_ID=MMETSP0661-20131031/528_1 /ASSEMBLY_ACC=CAM_ASM_000606 /TAXON_ID=109239 /ORGANISM="Alexandrium margalefi, Strain AMGDE01CS-322" /LENGTH=143 /DNA_ID=CAMNT_0051516703 /DNA_START=78 /DNA_END=509 /DNA_ORIENTATION=-
MFAMQVPALTFAALQHRERLECLQAEDAPADERDEEGQHSKLSVIRAFASFSATLSEVGDEPQVFRLGVHGLLEMSGARGIDLCLRQPGPASRHGLEAEGDPSGKRHEGEDMERLNNAQRLVGPHEVVESAKPASCFNKQRGA